MNTVVAHCAAPVKYFLRFLRFFYKVIDIARDFRILAIHKFREFARVPPADGAKIPADTTIYLTRDHAGELLLCGFGHYSSPWIKSLAAVPMPAPIMAPISILQIMAAIITRAIAIDPEIAQAKTAAIALPTTPTMKVTSNSR